MIVLFLYIIRGVTIFRIFDGTRYYIKLISESLIDIRFFLVMMFYSTFSFGILFIKSKEEKITFNHLWFDSYSLNFGENNILSNKEDHGI